MGVAGARVHRPEEREPLRAPAQVEDGGAHRPAGGGQSHTQCTDPSAFSAQCTTQAAALCVVQVDIRLPRYRATHTPTPSATPVGEGAPRTAEEAATLDPVYMDAMAFGMGCCWLQVLTLTLTLNPNS